MNHTSHHFFCLEPENADYATSRSAILPVPFERTTSYGKGTSSGPSALFTASQAVELWDEELGSEPFRLGIATLPPCAPAATDLSEAMAEIEAEARRHMEAGKFLVTLGGEHSLTIAPVRAAKAVFGPDLGVVQLDAHADLREEYEGSRYSHAAVMARVREEGLPALAVGIRSLSAPEARKIREEELPVVWGHELAELATPAGLERFRGLLDALPERVYLTFDVDYLDPALVPATGTPEPGGGAWYPTLALLRELFARKEVVAMDVVELAPIPRQPASDFLVAKLIYKCLGYLAEAEPG